MLNKFTFFIVVLLLNVTNSIAQNWETIIEMDNNIFPSYVLATANSDLLKMTENLSNNVEYFGDKTGVIGIKLSEIPENSIVKVEISENEILYNSYIEEKVSDGGKVYYIFPKINFKFEQLRKIEQQKPINIEFKLFIDNDFKGKKIGTASLRSLEECPWFVKDNIKNMFVSIPWMFSAYVNEDSPLINKILSNALKSGIVNQFSGYQVDQQSVIRQVQAIWYALQEANIRYSSITNTSLNSNQVGSQRVRMIDQSYNYSQANCVDGTVLFASVLKAIGIEPVLILIPGHMFLGYYLDKNHGKITFLETTMIGHLDLNNLEPNQLSVNSYSSLKREERRLKEIAMFQIGRTPTEKKQQISQQEKYIETLKMQVKKEASLINFNNATIVANEKYNSIKSFFGNNLNYHTIEVSEARKLVKPIWR